MLHPLWEKVVSGKRLCRLPKPVAELGEGSRGLAPTPFIVRPPLRATLGEPVVGLPVFLGKVTILAYGTFLHIIKKNQLYLYSAISVQKLNSALKNS